MELTVALLRVVEANAVVLLDQLRFGDPAVSFRGLFLLRVLCSYEIETPKQDTFLGMRRMKAPRQLLHATAVAVKKKQRNDTFLLGAKGKEVRAQRIHFVSR